MSEKQPCPHTDCKKDSANLRKHHSAAHRDNDPGCYLCQAKREGWNR